MEQDKRAIILASYQSDDIKKLADYIAVTDSGKMLGTFEKEELTESYQRYWFKEEIPNTSVPREVKRTENNIVSNNLQVTEEFFNRNNITWINRTAVDLDEVLAIMLTEKEKASMKK